MKKHTIGLVIGRFQPFHKGHLYLIKKSLELCDFIIIGIGSSNKKDSNNPFSHQLRKKMLEAVLQEEQLSSQVKKIISIPDNPSDSMWLKNVLKRVGTIDIVIGNNDWVNGIFQNAGYKIHKVPHFKRYLYEGYKVRNLMKKKKKWETRVPSYIVDMIK